MRRKVGLLWECTRCRKMLPRGWFARNGRGEGSRHAHCRECRREGKAADAARRRGAGVTKIPAGWILALYRAQRGLCAVCGRGLGAVYHADHRCAISRGGRHELGNLQLCCPRCNLRKSNK
jgi:5-methylcytosine-specific restriction endonuclease McrA